MTKTTIDARAKPVTVFAEGSWDMMHYNHIEFLCECKSMGDRQSCPTNRWRVTSARRS